MQTTEHQFVTWDGAQLFYRAWLPEAQPPGPDASGVAGATHNRSGREAQAPGPRLPPTKALVLFHRGHEHSGRWDEVVERLRLDNVAVFAWDARGHGKSPGARGSASSLMAVVKDIDCFIRHINEAYRIATEDMVVLAHSVGAVTVTAWVHDFAPRIRGLILGAPAFRVNLFIPFAIPMLRLKEKLLGPGYVQSYVKARLLTHDAEEARRYTADKTIFRQIAVNILLDLFDTSTRLLADAGAITVPTLILSAGSDWIVQLSAQQTFFQRLGSPVKEMEVYPKTYHAIFHETRRQEIIERCRQFIVQRFDQEPPGPSSAEAYTRAEFDKLRAPGHPIFGLIKAGLQTVGRLSRAIQIGWRHGFDSGVSLDYVYANQAHGIGWLGRFIDRTYLDSIGWRGIRQRKVNLERILRTILQTLHTAGRPVHIVDIATGGGRYVLETLHKLKDVPATAVLRDYQQVNLDAAHELAIELGLEERVAFIRGDAFDRASLQALAPAPTVAIVSGLYELFPDNEPVLNSLRGLADAVAPGGYLIYTNQPWHPQVEFIARVLTNREGRPWIMRRRTQAEMDELVGSAGFEKLGMDVDDWGIFTVSLARRL